MALGETPPLSEEIKKRPDERNILADLHERKEFLQKGKEKLREKSEQFREDEKKVGAVLEPFNGRHDLLFEALDFPKNLEKDAEPKPAAEEAEKFVRILGELDAQSPVERQAEMRGVVYLHLQEERVLEAEARLNGTREQAVGRQENFEMAFARTVTEFLDTAPRLAREIEGIIRDQNLSGDEKVTELTNLFAVVTDEGQRRSAEAFLGEFKKFAADMADFFEREKRDAKELEEERARHKALVKADEMRQADVLLARIPESPEMSSERIKNA